MKWKPVIRVNIITLWKMWKFFKKYFLRKNVLYLQAPENDP